MIHLMAWRNLGYSDDDFRDRVQIGTVGDDSVATVRDTPEYNMLYLSKFFRTLGMWYTAWTKEAATTPYAHLDEVEFLKRKFKVNGRYVFAPLRVSSIYEILLWETKGATDEDRRNSARAVLLEARHHSRELFNELRRVILRLFSALRIPLILATYEQMMDKFAIDYGEWDSPQ
jgi:hypothetical protein